MSDLIFALTVWAIFAWLAVKLLRWINGDSSASPDTTYAHQNSDSKMERFVAEINLMYNKPPEFRDDEGRSINLGETLAVPIFIPLHIKYGESDLPRTVCALKVIGEDILNETECDCRYIHAYCFLRNEGRTFRVDRINQLICLETGELFDDPELFFTRVVFDHRSQKLRKNWQEESTYSLSKQPEIVIHYTDSNGLCEYKVTVEEVFDASYGRGLAFRGYATRTATSEKRRWSGKKTFFAKDISNTKEYSSNQQIPDIENYLMSACNQAVQTENLYYPKLGIKGIGNPHMNGQQLGAMIAEAIHIMPSAVNKLAA